MNTDQVKGMLRRAKAGSSYCATTKGIAMSKLILVVSVLGVLAGCVGTGTVSGPSTDGSDASHTSERDMNSGGQPK